MAPGESHSESRRRQQGRLNNLSFPAADFAQIDEENASMPPTRAGLACEACRIRKTRCVGFPTCSWCQRRNQACVRGSNAPTNPLDAWGEQLLEAVNQAKDEILAATSSVSYVRDRATRHSTSLGSEANTQAHEPEYQAQDSTGSQRLSSTDNILAWEVFKPVAHALPHHDARTIRTHDNDRPLRVQAGADTSLPCLRRLQRRFELKFSTSQPLVSSIRLDRYIRDVAESGGSWTAESCLVFLMSALASACDCHTDNSDSTGPPSVPSSFTSVSASTPAVLASYETADRYWTMAKRRLAWALDNLDPLLTAQCTVLAGFWYLQNGSPTIARKTFSHAIQEAVEVHGAGFSGEDLMLASNISRTCAQLLQRLSTVLGPASSYQEAFLAQILQLSHTVYPIVDHFGQIRSEILNLLSMTPNHHHAMGIYMLTRRVTILHSRIPTSGSAGYESQESLQTELNSLLLRLCLKVYLHPHVAQSPAQTHMAFPSNPITRNVTDSSSELNELLALARQCIDSTAQLLLAYLASCQPHSDAISHEPFYTTASPSSSHKSSTGGCRQHTEAWFQYRSAYAGCLLLHAVAYAQRRASAGEDAYMHCLEVPLPLDWHVVVESTAAVLLAQPTGSDLWHCGRTLSAMAPLCGDGADLGAAHTG